MTNYSKEGLPILEEEHVTKSIERWITLGSTEKTLTMLAEIQEENELYLTSTQALAFAGKLMNSALGDMMLSHIIFSYKLLRTQSNKSLPIVTWDAITEVNGELYNSEVEKQRKYLAEIRGENRWYVKVLEGLIDRVKVKEEKEKNWGLYGGIFSYFLLKRQAAADLRDPKNN